MEFLAPHLLWSLPLAGLPLLIYWWNRRQAEPMEYPSLSWLSEQFRNQLQQSRQRRWLQVLWRVLMILLLIYLFSQPIIGGSSQPVDRTILVVDNSLSMEQTRVGQSALENSIEWIRDEFIPQHSTPVDIVVALPEPEIFSGTHRTIDEIETHTGQFTLASIQPWLSDQYNLSRTRVIIVTDAQESVFPRREWNGPNVELRVPFGEPDNTGIREAQLTRSPSFVGQPTSIEWTTSPDDVRPRRLLTADSVTVPIKESGRTDWTPSEPGPTPFRLELPDDGLEWDNRYRFVGNVRDRIELFIAGSSPATDSIRFALEQELETTDDPERADVIMISTGTVDEQTLNRLQGSSVEQTPKWILPGDSLDRDHWARIDSVLGIPWQFEGLVENTESVVPTVREPGWFGRGGDQLRRQIQSLDIRSFYRLSENGNDREILSLDGEPLLAQHQSWYLLTAPGEQFLSPETATTAWPTLLREIARELITRSTGSNWTVGEPVTFSESISFPVTIDGPDQQGWDIERPRTRWSPPTPGFYQIQPSEGERLLRAANYNPEEGDLKRPDPGNYPAGIRSWEPVDQPFRLSLTPWLWLTLLGMICVDCWWARDG